MLPQTFLDLGTILVHSEINLHDTPKHDLRTILIHIETYTQLD